MHMRTQGGGDLQMIVDLGEIDANSLIWLW